MIASRQLIDFIERNYFDDDIINLEEWSINVPTTSGGPLLHQLRILECPEYVEFLLRNGADVNAKGDLGWTAVYIAASRGFAETLILLFRAGASVEIENVFGETIFDFWCNYTKEIQDIILKYSKCQD